MKKLLFTIVAVLFEIALNAQIPVWDGTIAESYADGNGTQGNPYLISTPQQLALLAQQTNDDTGGDAYYRLTNDISLENSNGEHIQWTPIGKAILITYDGDVDTIAHYFKGTFDGGGKTIYGLYQNIGDGDTNPVGGLFGCTNGAKIKNVKIHSCDISGNAQYVGSLVGYAGQTDILNCSVEASSIVTDTIGSNTMTIGVAGGLIGYAGLPFYVYHSPSETYTIADCEMKENVSVGGYVAGGIVGLVNDYHGWHYENNYRVYYLIENCHNNNTDSFVQTSRFGGGIAGSISYTTISDCVNNCNIICEGVYVSDNFYVIVGGICGYARYEVYIISCLNMETGQIISLNDNPVEGGGIVGLITTFAEIAECRNKAVLSGVRIGGIGGHISVFSNIHHCVNEASLNGTKRCGGIVGKMDHSSVYECVNYGDISGNHMVGGLVGELGGAGYICGDANKGNVYGVSSTEIYVGGLVGGQVFGGKICNSYNCGAVGGLMNGQSGDIGVGGIVGYASGYIYNVYNIGAITSYDNTRSVNVFYGNIIGNGYTNYKNNCYWLDNNDLPASGATGLPDLPGSSAFHQGTTSTSWQLNEAQYGTSDLVEALNFGSEVVTGIFEFNDMPLVASWSEDIDGENNGYPVVASYPKYPLLGFEWYYNMTNLYGTVTYQHLDYMCDTTINHRKVKVIVKTNTLYDKSSNDSHEYILEDNGCVYWWHNAGQDSTMLYNFTALEGDEWQIKVGNDSITMHVDAVGNVEYNGQTFKSLTVSDENDIFSGTIVCGIGHLTSFFPERLLNKKSDYKVNGIRCCWNDGELVYQEGDEDCDAIYDALHMGVEEQGEASCAVYPNPTNGMVTIVGEDIAYVEVVNGSGQTIVKKRCGDGTKVDLSQQPAGVYFLRLFDSSGESCTKKIMKE
ncbi:MAG: T9SS type A sorting domain-containing protein [Bacteroidales bacterium]|nr:T9SS type A sorting domain-containing protein [Bacteroidales bacterium]